MAEQTGPSFDFRKLRVDERVARFTLYQVPGEPYLDMVHAGESNTKYFNSLLKRSRQNIRRARAGAIDASSMAQTRNEDRDLFPKFIIKGWGYKSIGEDRKAVDRPGLIRDKDGTEFGFSPTNVAAFLKALPNWLFDDVRLFAAEEANYIVEEDEEEVPDPDVVAGN